jgi:hypothetical protein
MPIPPTLLFVSFSGINDPYHEKEEEEEKKKKKKKKKKRAR